jgi:hypothetical protein
MNPLRKHGPFLANDLMFNGWLSAMLGLIAKTQAGAGLGPVAVPAVAHFGDPAQGPPSIAAERTCHGDLAPRG